MPIHKVEMSVFGADDEKLIEHNRADNAAAQALTVRCCIEQFPAQFETPL